MTDWAERIDELLAKKAQEEDDATRSQKSDVDTTALHQDRAEAYKENTLIPAFQTVKELLETPERGRTVEYAQVNAPGPVQMKLAIYKHKTGDPPRQPRTAEVHVSVEVAASPAGARIRRLFTERTPFYGTAIGNGNIDDVTEEHIVDLVMSEWVKAVEKGVPRP